MRRPHYSVYESVEHCHGCGVFGSVVVRVNALRPPDVKKTATCAACMERDGAPEDGWTVVPVR